MKAPETGKPILEPSALYAKGRGKGGGGRERERKDFRLG